jgi:nicotinamide-nucleotide amidase
MIPRALGGADPDPGGELGPTGGTGPGLAARIVGLLTRRGLTVATAESLTGGLVCAAITAVPGASVVFRGGVVAYATDLKVTLLGVPDSLLAAQGAVDPEVAGAMAEGVRERLGAAVGAATTGVAGPDPSEGKPPGTVHVAISAGGGRIIRTLALAGDRQQIRHDTVQRCLDLLWAVLTEEDAWLQRYVISEHATPRSPPLSVRAGTVDVTQPREGSALMVLLRHLLGDVLRRMRLRQGRTLREVSAAARVSLGYLSEVERGQKEASSELLGAICTALGTPLSQVFREVSDNFALAELQNEPVLTGAREPSLGGPAEPQLSPQVRSVAFDEVARRIADVDEVARHIRDVTDMVPV